jgi:parallel beta-helix repeat protein
MRNALTILSIVLFSSICLGATIYVPDHYPTIQGAINASASGDQIVVRRGTYVENIDFLGKAITVKSESGTGATTIDGNFSDTVVMFRSGEGADSVLEGFTITNGQASPSTFFGGGIYCDNASPTIVGNMIQNNTGRSAGGGIYCAQSSPLILDNTISQNTGKNFGGGICISYYSSPRITGNIISGNSASTGCGICCHYDSSPTIEKNTITRNGSGKGGGIYSEDGSVSIRFNRICNNESGGIYCTNANVTIIENVVDSNESDWNGAGIHIFDCVALVEKNTVTNNVTHVTYGGGIHCGYKTTGDIRNNVISGNTAIRGGGIECARCSASITDNVIARNHATQHGAGVLFRDASSPVFSRNTIKGNIADFDGGGAYSYQDALPVLSSNSFLQNSALKRNGGGLHVEESTVTLVSSTFAGNEAGQHGGAISLDKSGDAFATNTIIWDNDSTTGEEISIGSAYYSANFSIEFSDVEGGLSAVLVGPSSSLTWGAGMMNADPLFVDIGLQDCHIPYTSPCHNAGDSHATSLPDLDFEGDPRKSEGLADIGADEFHEHLYQVGSMQPGRITAIRVVGRPNEPIEIAFGSGILKPPRQTFFGKFYLKLPLAARYKLGNVPADGIATYNVTVPISWSSGEKYPVQAVVGPPWVWNTLLTNLMILEVE